MKPSQKQVSRLKNIKNRKVSSKKSSKMLKSLSKTKPIKSKIVIKPINPK